MQRFVHQAEILNHPSTWSHINPQLHTHTHTHTLISWVCLCLGDVCSVWQRWALWWRCSWGWARASLIDQGGGEERKKVEKRSSTTSFFEWMNEAGREVVFRVCGYDGTVGFFAFSPSPHFHISFISLSLSFTWKLSLSGSSVCLFSFSPFCSLNCLQMLPTHNCVAYSPSRRARDVTSMAQL